ncbi:RMD1 family protein [Bradyrhizobium barranii]|uniref:RMD1 family protein n=1 Tax=Bradyrhizobium TaxID=374 RepID=UPI003F2438CA
MSSTPVAFRTHAGLVVIFRYGVVVLIGLSPSEETALIDTLRSRVIDELSSYEEESAQVQLCNDQDAEVILPGGRICLSEFTDDRLLLIADTLAKSTALERDERRVAAVFDVIEPFARELAERGRTPRGRRSPTDRQCAPGPAARRGPRRHCRKARRTLGQAGARAVLFASERRVRTEGAS